MINKCRDKYKEGGECRKGEASVGQSMGRRGKCWEGKTSVGQVLGDKQV